MMMMEERDWLGHKAMKVDVEREPHSRGLEGGKRRVLSSYPTQVQPQNATNSET